MKKLALFVVAVFCFGAFGVSTAQARTFAFTNDSAEDTVTQLMTVRMAELLEEKSDGAFTSHVFGQSVLGSDVELAQSAQAGDIAFVFQTHAPTVNFVPELSVLDLPMIFANVEEARVVLDKFQPIIAEAYERAGFILLGFGDQGFREMSSNRRIEDIDDFGGIRVRTMANTYHVQFWQAIGANPTPLPWGEVYLSLQQGTIDAQENPLEVIVAARLHEVQDYILLTHHIVHTIQIIMSRQIFDSLTPEEQQLVQEAARETVLFAREQADLRAQERIEILEAAGVDILDVTPEMRSEMVAMAEPVFDAIRADVGTELVDQLLGLIDAARN